jgi:hypothetical protein
MIFGLKDRDSERVRGIDNSSRFYDVRKIVVALYSYRIWKGKLCFMINGVKMYLFWSSGQSSRPGYDSRHYQKKISSGSGTGSTQAREYN